MHTQESPKRKTLLQAFREFFSVKSNRRKVFKEQILPIVGSLILAYAWVTEQSLEDSERNYRNIEQAYNQFQFYLQSYSNDRQSQWLITTNFSIDSITGRQFFSSKSNDSIYHDALFRLATLEYKAFYSFSEVTIQVERFFNQGVFVDSVVKEVDTLRKVVDSYYDAVNFSSGNLPFLKLTCDSILKTCLSKTTFLKNKYSRKMETVDAQFHKVQKGIEDQDKSFAKLYIIRIVCIFGHSTIKVITTYVEPQYERDVRKPITDNNIVEKIIQSTVDQTIFKLNKKGRK